MLWYYPRTWSFQHPESVDKLGIWTDVEKKVIGRESMNPLWVLAQVSVLCGWNGTFHSSAAEGWAVFTQVNDMSRSGAKQWVMTAASGGLIRLSGTRGRCYIYAPCEQISDHNRFIESSHQLVQIFGLASLPGFHLWQLIKYENNVKSAHRASSLHFLSTMR